MIKNCYFLCCPRIQNSQKPSKTYISPISRDFLEQTHATPARQLFKCSRRFTQAGHPPGAELYFWMTQWCASWPLLSCVVTVQAESVQQSLVMKRSGRAVSYNEIMAQLWCRAADNYLRQGWEPSNCPSLLEQTTPPLPPMSGTMRSWGYPFQIIYS